MSAQSASQEYWDARAARFGHVGAGLPAICSYGMPSLYNQAIHACQYRALAEHLHEHRGRSVLDVGCGVGRWSLRLAKGGSLVTGVDLSPMMIDLARKSAALEQLPVEFLVADVAELALGKSFDAIFSVTMLQHVMDDRRFHLAVHNLARHLLPNGKLVLLEVAPERPTSACNSRIFTVRSAQTYVDALRSAGLSTVSIKGVDIGPLRPVLMPLMKRMPASLGRGLLTASTLLSLPLDLLASRHLTRRAWHKVIVATRLSARP
jgi:ubiquinone/menaquinone biosynthesis C-methylase UbiE